MSLPVHAIDSKSERPFNTRVERIVFVGLSKEPATITFGGESLVFVTRKSGKEFIVTVKNPNMKIGDVFEVLVAM